MERHADAPEPRATTEPPAARVLSDPKIAALVGLVGVWVYGLSLDFGVTGDATYYANIIDTTRFDQLSLHQGYYVVGGLFSSILAATAGISTTAALTWLAGLTGAALPVLGYLLLRQASFERLEALLGAVMLLTCHRVFMNATAPEVYALQTGLLWAALLAFQRHRAASAGLLAAGAMWVSPLTALCAPWFLVLAWRQRMGLIPVLWCGGVSFALYLPFWVYHYDEVLWGTRGLLQINAIAAWEPLQALINFARFQFKHYSVLNLLLLPALWQWRRHPTPFLVLAGLAPQHLYLVTKLTSEDNVFLLSLDVVLVMLMLLGWRTLRTAGVGWIGAALLAIHVGLFVIAEAPARGPLRVDYPERMRALAAALPVDAVLVADWARRMDFVYYNNPAPTFPLESGPLYDTGTLDIDEARKRLAAGETVRHLLGGTANAPAVPLYVLESYQPSGWARLLLPAAELERRRQAASIATRTERLFGRTCTPVPDAPLPLLRCD